MNIVQITPGAGGMYCGNCFRDNALVAELRRRGQHTLMVPLYLPIKLDEEDQSAGTPIFFSGINVYLDQKSSLFRRAPDWLHRLLASPTLLRWASGRAAKTRADDVGDLMLSMLRGEEGLQARELDELCSWLATQSERPDVVCLSNALLIGLARQLRARLGTPVVCMLQGEDAFLDALPSSHRQAAWDLLAERARDADLLVAPSRYFADRMTERLRLDPARVRVVPNGLNLDDFNVPPSTEPTPEVPAGVPPVIGYFARMCPEKGLETLVEAFIRLKQSTALRNVRLHIGGGLGPNDEAFVNGLKQRLEARGMLGDVRFSPNIDRAGKIQFYQGLTVFSVPAKSGEAFGLYLIESLAAGVPVVQPRAASFPEIIEATGGGVLCEPDDPQSLADALANLLREPSRARELGRSGQQAVREQCGVGAMAARMLEVFGEARALPAAAAARRS